MPVFCLRVLSRIAYYVELSHLRPLLTSSRTSPVIDALACFLGCWCLVGILQDALSWDLPDIFLLVRRIEHRSLKSLGHGWLLYFSVLLASASMKLESNVCGKLQAQFGKSQWGRRSPRAWVCPSWPSVLPAHFPSLLALLRAPRSFSKEVWALGHVPSSTWNAFPPFSASLIADLEAKTLGSS